MDPVLWVPYEFPEGIIKWFFHARRERHFRTACRPPCAEVMNFYDFLWIFDVGCPSRWNTLRQGVLPLPKLSLPKVRIFLKPSFFCKSSWWSRSTMNNVNAGEMLVWFAELLLVGLGVQHWYPKNNDPSILGSKWPSQQWPVLISIGVTMVFARERPQPSTISTRSLVKLPSLYLCVKSPNLWRNSVILSTV